jgi:virginiamycin B lyase
MRLLRVAIVSLTLIEPALPAVPPTGAYTTISTYFVPATKADIAGIVTGPDGALWFTESNVPATIGRLTTAGDFTGYLVPFDSTYLAGITVGSDGALWFTDPGGPYVGRVTTSGAFTMYPALMPEPLGGITAGPDGALWFTAGEEIGRITTTGSLSAYPAGLRAVPSNIVTGSDGALWYTGGEVIGRITVEGQVTNYPLSGYTCSLGIASGPDGAIWFTDPCAGNIGRITTTGEITTFPVPVNEPNIGPNFITTGPDGALWFTETGGSYRFGFVGRITTSGVITEFPVPPGTVGPNAITTGPDGALWYGTYTLVGKSQIQRAPACALGFSASFSGDALTLNYNLGIDTPATFNVLLHTSAGVSEPFSEEIPVTVPPLAFSKVLSPFPDFGTVVVESTLANDPGGNGLGICGEWTTVGTSSAAVP